MQCSPIKDTMDNGNDIKQDYSNVLFALFLLMVSMLVIVPAAALPVKFAIIILLALMANKDIFVAVPYAALFMDNIFGDIPGTSLAFYWVFFGFTFIRYFIFKKINISKKFFIPLAVILSYLLFTNARCDFHGFLINLGYFATIVLIQSEVFEDMGKIRIQFAAIGIFALLSGLLSFVSIGRVGFYEAGGVVVKRLGSVGFNDPNYSSLMYNVAILALLCTRFKKYDILRKLMIAGLYYFLIRTLSINGLMCNLIIILFITLMRKGIDKKVKAILFLIAIGCVLYLIFPILQTDYFIQGYTYRFSVKLSEYMSGDYLNATTGRSMLFYIYWSYFWGMPAANIFFGLKLLPLTESISISTAVPHNTYIDTMYATGLTGLILLNICIIERLVSTYKAFRKTEQIEYLGLAGIKVVMLVYGFGLSMFELYFWQSMILM